MTEMPHIISEDIIYYRGLKLKIYHLSNGKIVLDQSSFEEVVKLNGFCDHIFELFSQGNFSSSEITRCHKCHWIPVLEQDPNLRR